MDVVRGHVDLNSLGGSNMKKDTIALTVLVVLAVGFLSLVLVLMKSPMWIAFPAIFGGLGLVCYGIDDLIVKFKNRGHEEREA